MTGPLLSYTSGIYLFCVQGGNPKIPQLKYHFLWRDNNIVITARLVIYFVGEGVQSFKVNVWVNTVNISVNQIIPRGRLYKTLN